MYIYIHTYIYVFEKEGSMSESIWGKICNSIWKSRILYQHKNLMPLSHIIPLLHQRSCTSPHKISLSVQKIRIWTKIFTLKLKAV